MTENERFTIAVDSFGHKFIQELSLNGSVWQQYDNIYDIAIKLNEQYDTIQMWVKSSEKIIKLLEENTKPTAKDGFKDVYLDIDNECKRCKYEKTVICNKCAYFSNYFLDCRLMMDDSQYRKALELGLVKND